MIRIKTGLLVLGLLCGLFVSISASAQLSHNLSVGNPVALAMGNSAIAYPLGVDSIHYNPAALSRIKQQYTQYKFQLAFFDHSGKVSGSGPGTSFDPFDNPKFQQDPLLQGKTSRSIDITSPSLFLPEVGHLKLPFYIAPGFGKAFRSENQKFVFANSAIALQTFGYQRDAENVGAFNGQEFGITRIAYFNPSVSFEMAENFYFGASLGFSWQGLGVTTRSRSALNTIGQIDALLDNFPSLGLSLNPYNDVGTLQMEMSDPLSVSYTIGFLWDVTPWLSFGFTYQSEGKSRMEGEYEFRYNDDFQNLMSTLQPAENLLKLFDGGPISAASRQSGEVAIDYTQPAWAGLGMSCQVTSRTRVNVDVKWVGYEVVEEMRFEFDQPLDYLVLASVVNNLSRTAVGGDYADPNELALQRRYQSVFDWSIGFEYDYSDALKLRFGYEPRSSSIPEDRQDLLIPIGEAQLYTLGFGYRFSPQSTLDFGLGYFVTELDIKPGESRNSNSNIEGDVIYNPYRALQVDHKVESHILALTYSTHF